MAKQHKFLWAITLGVASGILSSPAHAGWVSNWYDSINRAYTFRLDQKENVTPDRPYNPQEVYVPYYDEEMAHTWSNHYAGQPMQAVKGMDESTRVMRPAPGSYITKHDEIEPYRHMPRGQVAYNHTPGGYQMVERRDAINWRNEYNGGRAQIYVGEPGSTPWNNQASGGRLGVKTQIGQPTHNWRDEPGHLRIDARPGDYNYQPQTGGKYEERMVDATRLGQRHDGVEVSRSYGYTEYGAAPTVQADRYTVENGDTLSGISSKPKIYNDWKLWPLIHDANRGQIKDPDYITPGQNLAIERGHTQAQKADARSRASAKTAPHIYTDMQ